MKELAERAKPIGPRGMTISEVLAQNQAQYAAAVKRYLDDNQPKAAVIWDAVAGEEPR